VCRASATPRFFEVFDTGSIIKGSWISTSTIDLSNKAGLVLGSNLAFFTSGWNPTLTKGWDRPVRDFPLTWTAVATVLTLSEAKSGIGDKVLDDEDGLLDLISDKAAFADRAAGFRFAWLLFDLGSTIWYVSGALRFLVDPVLNDRFGSAGLFGRPSLQLLQHHQVLSRGEVNTYTAQWLWTFLVEQPAHVRISWDWRIGAGQSSQTLPFGRSKSAENMRRIHGTR